MPKVTLRSTVPLPVKWVITPVFQDGSHPPQHAHKHSSPLQHVSNTTIAKINEPQTFLSFFYLFWKISSRFHQPHESVTKSLQRATRHIIAIGNLKSQLSKYSICLLFSELGKGLDVKCFICEKYQT